MMKMLNKKRKKGFTLIELIVVIAILGILAAIAIPRFANVTADANTKAAQANRATIEGAAQLYIAAQAGNITAISSWSTTSTSGGLSAYLKTPLYQPGSTSTGYTVDITTGGAVTITP